jgi:lipopolysaccharide transport system ATP-binding protein
MACNTNYYDKFLPIVSKGTLLIVNWEIKIPFAMGDFRIDIGIKPDVFNNQFYDRVFCASTLTVACDAALLKKNFGGYLLVNSLVNFSLQTALNQENSEAK